MRKICFTITTRGNYGKIKTVLHAVDAHPDLDYQLILGGGALLHRFGNIGQTVKDSGFRVDHSTHFIIEGETPTTMAKSFGLAVIEYATIFEQLKPDVVFIIADRYEMLAIASAAALMNIPLAHMEGGEVSGSIDESIRHAITKMSHIHFPASQEAAERIHKLGESKEMIHTVGSTSFDLLNQLDLNDIQPVNRQQEISGVGPLLDLRQPYLTVIQHPVTTEYTKNQEHIREVIAVIDELAMNTVWIWPNMDAGTDAISKEIRSYREKQNPEFVHFFTSLPLELYGPLLKNTACLIGNSSSGLRESAFLGTPTVNIGTRQSGRARGHNVIDVPNEKQAIMRAVKAQMEHGPYERDLLYGDGTSGDHIAAILASADFQLQKQIIY